MYAYGGAGSSSSHRGTPSPPPALSSGFSSQKSEEKKDVIDGGYVSFDEAETHVLARFKRRSEHTRLREVATNDAELEEALRLIEGQKAEEEAVQ
jgi:F0F1-type ATP synthase epsilon subunit